jgi:hypothetical protein
LYRHQRVLQSRCWQSAEKKRRLAGCTVDRQQSKAIEQFLQMSKIEVRKTSATLPKLFALDMMVHPDFLADGE